MNAYPYRIIEHTADTGFEVQGETVEQVFEAAALAFFSIMWRIATPEKNEPVAISITGGDLEEILVNFLEEFLYLYDAKNLVCTAVNVETITAGSVQASARLQAFAAGRDEELLSVKAVTYHQLYLGKTNNSWTARIFLDI